jgi:hypothetical protein
VQLALGFSNSRPNKKSRYEANLFLSSALVDLYAKCDAMVAARGCLVAWKGMIRSHGRRLYPGYHRMGVEEKPFDV